MMNEVRFGGGNNPEESETECLRFVQIIRRLVFLIQILIG